MQVDLEAPHQLDIKKIFFKKVKYRKNYFFKPMNV